MAKDCCVTVLMGGEGDERQVSLESGRCVAQALRNTSIKVIESDITLKDMSILDNKQVDVFFVALHGKFGEDGQLQEILERKKLKYTGSGTEASKLAFDKILSKKVFVENNIPTPEWVEVSEFIEEKALVKAIERLGGKYVVKPACQGSSVGIEMLNNPLDAARAATVSLVRFGPTLVEKFIPGRELTVGILGEKALPIIEIKTKQIFYDYQAKYIDDNTEYLFDTIKDESLTKKIQAMAMKCFNVLGCRHLSRVDFLLDSENNPYVLEVNTIPGMTSHSLLPKAAGKAGMNMTELCSKIVNLALD